jgi:hypothetical protein
MVHLMRSTRRRILACLPPILATTPALAFRLEESGAQLAAEYAEGCAAMLSHDELRAEMETRFEGRAWPSALQPRLAELLRCPFCGCAVTGIPDGEKAMMPRG